MTSVCMYVCMLSTLPGAITLFRVALRYLGCKFRVFKKNHGVFTRLIVVFSSAAMKFCFFSFTESTGYPQPVLDIFFWVHCCDQLKTDLNCFAPLNCIGSTM
jgi:hypothetical protein